MSAENRKHPRFPTSLETIYFCQNDSTENERMYFPGVITSKSKGGIGMQVNYPHFTEELVWLEGLGDTCDPIAGHVRWRVPEDDGKETFEIGIKFAVALDN